MGLKGFKSLMGLKGFNGNKGLRGSRGLSRRHWAGPENARKIVSRAVSRTPDAENLEDPSGIFGLGCPIGVVLDFLDQQKMGQS